MVGRPRKRELQVKPSFDALAKPAGGISGLKELLAEYLGGTIEDTLDAINELPAKDKVAYRMKLMDYVMPKQQAIKTEERSQSSIAEALLDRQSVFDDEDDESD